MSSFDIVDLATKTVLVILLVPVVGSKGTNDSNTYQHAQKAPRTFDLAMLNVRRKHHDHRVGACCAPCSPQGLQAVTFHPTATSPPGDRMPAGKLFTVALLSALL